ncbi:BTB/POZ protein [Podospora didyma]|uniref:BTB/POZ protein n=1 Tax=Podospora didyma TaxID=330526 RepID=A0AAE0U8L2_9PEZI|nr:BTB/POZ protein [Podospora didyma]
MAPDLARSTAFGHLLDSGEYSDLKFVCQGQEFKVHKVVVCTQSPVLAAATRGPFQEATTGVIDIEGFAAEVVRSMVEYLYTGDYDPNPRMNPDSRDGMGHISNPVQPLANEGVRHHVRVSVVADYYNIPGLAQLANAKIQSAPAGEWDAQALLDATKESLNIANDQALRETMAILAAQNLKKLLDTDQLGDLIGDFGVAVLKKYTQEVEQLRRDLNEKSDLLAQSVGREMLATENADRNAARAARVQENMSRCLETLREKDCCRNSKCRAEFKCYIETRGQQPVYTLRCAKCGCRH